MKTHQPTHTPTPIESLTEALRPDGLGMQLPLHHHDMEALTLCDKSGRAVALVKSYKDGQAIVRAVNAHEELLAEVKKQRDMLKSIICPRPTAEIIKLENLIARAEDL